MSILIKMSPIFSIKEPKFTRRLFTRGWENTGYVRREPDNRTTEQLLENIDYFAQKCPEVAKFKDDLKAMNPKHLGLISDICELANHYEFINSGINIKRLSSNGKSLFEFLMEKLPIAAKENPASLQLSKEIINNTDAVAAKYVLGSLSSIYDCKETAKHIEAILPLVKNIAKSTLSGGFMKDYSKEQKFVNEIKALLTPSVSLNK